MRQYIVNSWLDSAENYDVGDTYSGRQIGNPNQKSIGVHISRSGDQWYANTAAYSDEAIQARKAKPRKEIPIQYKITPAQRTISRLESIREELESKFESGQLEFSEYVELSHALDIKLERAWKNLDRQLGKVTKKPERQEQENASSSVFDLFKAGMQAIPEGVCKGSAKKQRKECVGDTTFFLTSVVALTMIFLTISNL